MESPSTSLTPTTLSRAAEISLPYASQILSGKRKPSRRMALRIARVTGHKLGPLANCTDAEIAVLAKFEADEISSETPVIEGEA